MNWLCGYDILRHARLRAENEKMDAFLIKTLDSRASYTQEDIIFTYQALLSKGYLCSRDGFPEHTAKGLDRLEAMDRGEPNLPD